MNDDKFKLSIPIITNEEELIIDNSFHGMLDELIKKQIKFREEAITQRLLMNVYKENKQLKEEKENLIKWITLIKDIGFDYDGYNDVKNLKLIIDELVYYSRCALSNVDYGKWQKEGKYE